jgi:hypothetical protein
VLPLDASERASERANKWKKSGSSEGGKVKLSCCCCSRMARDLDFTCTRVSGIRVSSGVGGERKLSQVAQKLERERALLIEKFSRSTFNFRKSKFHHLQINRMSIS